MSKKLSFKQSSSLILAGTLLVNISPLNAATLQANAGIHSSFFYEGINLTDDLAAASFSSELSFDQGTFTGIDCYAAETGRDILKRGCSYYLGYFQTLNNNQAFSFLATNNDYTQALNQDWDFVEFSANWHINRSTNLSVNYSDDWFNRGYDSFALKGDFSQSLSDNFSASLALSFTSLGEPSQVDNFTFAKASLNYNRQRWSANLSISRPDKELTQIIPFDVDQSEISLTITYRLH